MKSSRTVLVPKKERILTAQAYFDEMRKHADIIEEVVFIPPKIGSRDYGSFRVRYSTAVLFR